MFTSHPATPHHIQIKARTILLDWFNIAGHYIASGSYISTQQSIESIMDELFELASQGKHPGLTPMRPDGINEYALSVVIRPLYGALGIAPKQSFKVAFDPVIPTRLLNLYEFERLRDLANDVVDKMKEIGRYSLS